MLWARSWCLASLLSTWLDLAILHPQVQRRITLVEVWYLIRLTSSHVSWVANRTIRIVLIDEILLLHLVVHDLKLLLWWASHVFHIWARVIEWSRTKRWEMVWVIIQLNSLLLCIVRSFTSWFWGTLAGTQDERACLTRGWANATDLSLCTSIFFLLPLP